MRYKNFYFLGIGGIGMSAIARYFNSKGYAVAGYDRTRSKLCETLEKEGVNIHYNDDCALIPDAFRNERDTLVIYTPAIPADNNELQFFREHSFCIEKRAQVLGEITRSERGLCIAGTHGKTTTSTMTAHLLKQSHIDCNAFLGGISKNYNSNLLLSDKSDLVVIEADEFDRSFHHLTPYMAVITAVDADHLDIYGTHEAYIESFAHFTSLIQKGGCLIMKKGLPLSPRVQQGVKVYTYSANEKADFYADNIHYGNGELRFDFATPDTLITDINLGVPVTVNIENGVAAMAMAWLNGATATEIRDAMATFAGTNRRFNFILKTDKLVMMDDYAHHPEELKACITSVRNLYPGKRILGIFQPHLFSRTRDFYKEFAKSLSMLNGVILLPIYPAREKPIPGITSEIILDEVTADDKRICSKERLCEEILHTDYDVYITIGAGDIELLIPEIKETLSNKA